MTSPTSNDRYKYHDNKELYPFQIPISAGRNIYKSLELSTCRISQHFKGSWKPYNPSSYTKPSAYHSVCWLDVLRYTFHTLVAPYLASNAAKALAAVIRGITIMLLRNVSHEDIEDMER